jgi:hypothetical protein
LACADLASEAVWIPVCIFPSVPPSIPCKCHPGSG